MHIILSTKELRDALDLIARVSVKHPTLPILQCVLIKTIQDSIVIQATNLEIGIESKISAKIINHGSVAVPANIFLQTISLTSQNETELELQNNNLIIRTKSSKTLITTQSPEDFPIIPTIEDGGQVINGKNFAQGIKTTAFASSQNTIKPELGSIYIHQKKEQTITFVSTDSFRLVEKTVFIPNFILQQNILIPAKNALEIARIADYFNKDPIFKINENQCMLSWGDTIITTRLMVGNFPDYQQIIPKEFTSHTTLLIQDIINTLKKTNIFLNKFSQLTLSLKDGSLLFTAISDNGTTEEKITTAQEGGDITISVNQKYIQDILSFITDDSLIIHFTGIGRPLVIEGVYDKSLKYLVMPMNR